MEQPPSRSGPRSVERPDPMLFDRRIDAYERARPPYPEELYRRLREREVVGPGRRILEIGAGSGQATQALVEAGCLVTAVEPGPTLAARLAERLPDVEVVNTTLEHARLPDDAFDSAVSATAFHWVDLETALPALARALTAEGLLAVWWNVFGDPGVRTPFRDAVAAVTARRRDRPDPGDHAPGPLGTASWTASLRSGGWFEVEHTEQLRWTVSLDAARVRDLFSTFSDWSDAEVDQVSRAAEQLGGTVTEHYVTALYLCRRTARRTARRSPS